MAKVRTKIEQAGIDELRRIIRPSDILASFITDNEKELSWDGNIYLKPHGMDKKIENIRIPVQVKGTTIVKAADIKIDQQGKRFIMSPIEVEDLKNYYLNDGVIFFTDVMNNDYEDHKMFYAALLPVMLKGILGKCKNRKGNLQKTKSVKLTMMPTNILEIEQVFTTFIDNKDAQKGKPIRSIEHYISKAADHQINFKAIEPFGTNLFGRINSPI